LRFSPSSTDPADGPTTALSVRLALFALLLTLPWLNPFAAGPSTWVGPWLFSAICAAAVFALGRGGVPCVGLGALLAGIAGWTLVRSGLTPETLALVGGCVLVWLMASFAAWQARDPAMIRAIALAWLAAALVSTGAALLQYVGWADRFQPWVDVSAAGEAFANLRQRNQFASLTAIGMAALLWLDANGRRRWLAFAAMAWLALGNAATTSRTGSLELLLLGALTWRWTGLRSARMQLWVVGLAAYTAGAIGLPLLAQAAGIEQNPLWMRVTETEACGSRMVLWSNVMHLIALRPWLGWGWGELDYAHYMTLYPGARFCDILDNAHNLPLHLAVELGLPAALVICGSIAWAGWRARPWNEGDRVRQLAWSIALVLALHSMLEYPIWYGPFQMALGLSLGLLWPGRETSVQRAKAFSPLLGVAALVALGYAAWDYHRASQIYLPEEQRSPAWRHEPLAGAAASWLFRDQVRFAELTLTPLTPNNARWTYERAKALLHYSPEPRVIEKLIESEVLLHRQDEVLAQLARYRAAFPDAYEKWRAGNATLGSR
jgi:O-antigen ligase